MERTMRKDQITLAEIQPKQTDALERQILADAMVHTDIVHEIAGTINEEMFTSPDRAKMWRTIIDISNSGNEPTIDKVAAIVGPSIVLNETQKTTSSADYEVRHRATLIRDAAARRRAYVAGLAFLQSVADGSLTEADVYAELQAMEDRVEGGYDPRGEVTLTQIFNRIYEGVEERLQLEKEGKQRLVPTGFPILDYFVAGGWNRGQLITLAARPSVGKTALMLQLAKAAAKGGFPTCIFSLEMTDEQLGERYLYSTGRVTPFMLRKGFTGDYARDDAALFDAAVAQFDKLPIIVNDTARNLKDIVSRITLNVKRGRCRIAFIDYLGYIQNETDARKSTAQVIAEITGRLKALAKDLRIPIVLLCQLNRDSARGNREPELYDLRDSGAIEQDSDIVLMLEEKDTDGDHFIRVWLRKNRPYKRNIYVDIRPNESYTNFTAFDAWDGDPNLSQKLNEYGISNF